MPAPIRPLVLLAIAAAAAAASDQDQAFPFQIPWEPAAGTVVDSSALVPAPVRARVRVAGDRLVDEAGAAVRLLGVNLVGPSCFPDPAEVPALARRLRWLGVNCVRLHHMDTPYVKPNLFSAEGGAGTDPDPASLARLDALIAGLAEQGIRIDLNLHVGRVYGPELGFAASSSGPAATGKAVGLIDPQAIALQRRFAAALLDRVNPLRGMRLADDPVLAMVEVINEDGLVVHAADLPGLPAAAAERLRTGWNAFLRVRHGSTAALLAAWNREVQPLGPDLLGCAAEPGLGLAKEEFAPAALDLEAAAGEAGTELRVAPRTASTTSWHLQLHRRGVALRPRQAYTWVFWARADRPRQIGISARLDHRPWTQAGLERTIDLDAAWRRYAIPFTATDTASPRCRLSWSFAADATPFALRGVELREGGGGVDLGSATLEAGDLAMGSVGSDPAGRDWLDYLVSAEAAFVDGMRDFIHRDLRCQAGIIASQTYFGGLAGVARESRMDIADTHAYWEHPEFPNQSWSREGFTIANTPMSACGSPSASILHRAAASRPAGIPFTVTEYDHAAPSEYAADTVPLAYAIAARQDWSGLFLFQYLWSVDAQSRRPNIRGWFDNVQHPAKLAFLPIAAEMYLAGAVPAADGAATLRIPRGEVAGITAAAGVSGSGFWDEAVGADAALGDLTLRRLGVSVGAWPRPALAVEAVREPRPVRWGAAEVVFDAPRLAGAVGRIRGREIAAGPLRIRAETSPRDYAAAVLASRDGRPLDGSGRMLLAIIDKAENAGLAWKAGRQSAEHPWDGEVLVTGVSAAISLRTAQRDLQVWALDGSGSRRGPVAAAWTDGELRFATSPSDRTVWYEIGR